MGKIVEAVKAKRVYFVRGFAQASGVEVFLR
jgi:hypothetical protein